MKTSINLIFISILLISQFSCKKKKLKGKYESILGKWKWTHTVYQHKYMCHSKYEAGPFYETITVDSTKTDYYIEFLRKGILKFYKNDSITNEFYLISFEKNTDTEEILRFNTLDIHDKNQSYIEKVYKLENGELKDLSSTFPFINTSSDPYCASYSNYFEKFN